MDRASKDQLLMQISVDRERFDEALAKVPPDRLADPVLPGSWSVKDVLAHIAWGEREAVGVVRARALVGSELWNLPQDDRNEAVVRESRSRGLQAVLDDYRATFDEYLAAMEELSDDDLNEPERFPGLSETIPDWRPWRVLYDPIHYDEHRETIEAAFGIA